VIQFGVAWRSAAVVDDGCTVAKPRHGRRTWGLSQSDARLAK
jgi:hypothetical protein